MKTEINYNPVSLRDALVQRNEGHVFRCHFFTQNLTPFEFTLHEEYYMIKGGKVCEADGFYETGDDPLTIILGEDLGKYDVNADYTRQHYDIDLRELKKSVKKRKK
jgi:hypothetical protein